MSIQELFIASNEALQKVVAQIRDDQWELELPDGMPNVGPNILSAVIRRHTYDDAWVPDVLDGKTKEEVGEQYEPLLSTGDIKDNYAKYNKRANEAVQGFDDLERVTHLSYGDFPAKIYLQHVTSFRAFRSYDLAKLIGADTTMAPDFVQALLDEYGPVIEDYRKMGVFPAALEAPNDASPQTKLLAMVGRE
jgi:uncharacterized protein (TIGR03086 family)